MALTRFPVKGEVVVFGNGRRLTVTHRDTSHPTVVHGVTEKNFASCFIALFSDGSWNTDATIVPPEPTPSE